MAHPASMYYQPEMYFDPYIGAYVLPVQAATPLGAQATPLGAYSQPMPGASAAGMWADPYGYGTPYGAGAYDALSGVYAAPSTVAGGPPVLAHSASAVGAYTTPSKSGTSEFEEPETGGYSHNYNGRPLTMMERHKQGLGVK